jgi:ribosomal protein L11 methyltransferase
MATARLVIKATKQLRPLLSELLFEAGAQGIEEQRSELVLYAERRETLTRLWRRVEGALAAALDARALPSARFENVAEGWQTKWMDQLRPVRLTARLLLAPEADARASERVIVYRPALAFGDGAHPTTRLAARAIEAHYRAQAGGALLDIGSGSGVLSFVALGSGARRALGVDVDRRAVRAAAHNAELNALSRQCRFVHGSVRPSGSFDLVVVNIELRPLLQVLSRLPAAARRAPRLLATGLLKSQVAEVTLALKAAGFSVERRRSSGEWALLDARRDRSRARAH